MKLLEVSNLTKSYKDYGSELRRIFNWILPTFKPLREYCVFKDINIIVNSGEAIGLIGVNGAGKSTLLKIITGTLQPTSGIVTRTGKISAILELGMGFNPNLTGRQNIIHSAGLMGHSLEEIQRALPEIESFAEVGEFFDKPVRIYSSGMQVRIAFAVATAFRPDLLIIDEALSVGDSYFQHKSFNKIKELQDQGTTLIIVSHDKSAVLSLCSRCILIDKGQVIKDGNPSEVLDIYNALIAISEESKIEVSQRNSHASVSSGSGEAKIEKILILNQEGIEIDTISVGEKVKIRLKVKVIKAVPVLVFGYLIKNKYGQSIFGTNTWHTSQVVQNLKPNDVIDFEIEFLASLGEGSYSLTTSLSGSSTHIESNYEWLEYAALFTVVNTSKYSFVGCNWLDAKIQTKVGNNER